MVSAAAVIAACAVAEGAATLDTQFHSPAFTAQTDAHSVVTLPDDSFLVLNGFKQLNGEATEGLVKFNADGTRDTTFQFPRGFVEVTAVAPLADGRLIVAAHREEKSGRKSYPILRLSANGTIDSSFNAGEGADDVVRSITIDNNGKILVGGFFTTFRGASRPFLVRLNADGSIDSTLQPISLAPNAPLHFQLGLWANIVVQPDGKILIGGQFTKVNGTAPQTGAAYGLARLNPDGSLDASFVPSGYSMRQYFNDGGGTGQYYPVRAVAVDDQQRVLVGGRLTTSSTGQIPMVRLTSTGSLQQTFPHASDGGGLEITAIALAPSHDVFASGSRVRRFTVDGASVPGYELHTFSAGSDPAKTAFETAETVALRTDGKVLIGGVTYVDGQRRNGIASFDATGNLDALALGDFETLKLPTRIASRTDGKVYVQGSFDRVDGTPRGGIARLSADGTLDNSFDPLSFGIKTLGAFILQQDDKVVIDGNSGDPGSSGQLTRRLNADDSNDGSFSTTATSQGYEFYRPLIDSNGDYLDSFPQDAQLAYFGAGGYRVLANGSYDTNIGAGTPHDYANVRDPGGYLTTVYSGDNRIISALPDGRMLVCYYDKTATYNLVRLNHDGTRDTTFNSGAVLAPPVTFATRDVRDAYGPPGGQYPTVRVALPAVGVLSDVLLTSDNKLIVVGAFQSYSGVSAGSIVRLLSDGTVDNSFAAGAGAQWTTSAVDGGHVPRIDQIKLLPDGRFVITGNFEAFDGVAAPGIAVLNADGSIDKTFTAPIELREDDPYGPFPPSQVTVRADGTLLLAGRYAEPGAQQTRSISHISMSSGAPTHFANISTRMRVEIGDDVLIGGFIVTGSAPKKVLVRAIGPSLPVDDKLVDTTLELHTSDGQVIFNDNWKDNQQAEIAATGVPPASELESAIVATLPPGGHTAIVRGNGNTTGVALVEVYDLEQSGASALANISTRGRVETGDNVMIGGIIITGDSAAKVLVRAIGPSLPVANSLQNPVLELHDTNGNVTRNDDWKDLQQAEIAATGAAPSDDRESAIVTTLAPGSYTAVVRGAGDTTGVALVEAFKLQ